MFVCVCLSANFDALSFSADDGVIAARRGKKNFARENFVGVCVVTQKVIRNLIKRGSRLARIAAR